MESINMRCISTLNLLLCPATLGFKTWREPARDGRIWSGDLATDPAYRSCVGGTSCFMLSVTQLDEQFTN
jgi:hypothetical protein